MFSDKLFNHKYDIDDLIRAFLGDDHTTRWLLNSRNGEVELGCEKNAHIQDGDDNGYLHEIIPLPIHYRDEILSSPSFNKLDSEEKKQVLNILEEPSLHLWVPHFSESYAGGWVRERVKETIMEWLDMRGMIPPSMKHVWKVSEPTKADFKVSKINIL